MIVPSVAGVGRRRLLIALLALSLLVTAAARAGDAEAHGRVPSPPHAVVHGASADAAGVAPTATEAFAASFPSFELAGGDIARAVCGLLAKPVKTGVAGLIGVLSKRVVVGTLAGALFAEIGFNPWCRGRYGALRRRLRAVAHAKPQLRPRIGPFVFNVAARYIGQDARFDRLQVTWTEFTLTSPLHVHYVWCRIDEGRWFEMSGTAIDILRGSRAQFAVRVDNTDGISSPFVYTPDYQLA